MEVLQDTYTKIGLNLEILNGFPAKSTFFNNENKGLPLIRIRNILKGHSETYYSGEFDSKYLIKNGDILIGMDGDFNIAKWTGIPSILNQRICKLIDAKDPFSLEYLYYYLEVELKKIQARTPSTTVKHLSIKDLRKVNAYCPPLPEQQKIADILSTVDEQISTTDKIIEKSKELKKGLMQKLFSEGIGHTEFKDTKIGRMPKGWEVKKVSDLCDVKGGKRVPKGHKLSDEKTDYPYIRVADMSMMKVNTDNLLYLQKDTQEAIKRYVVSKDDVFVSVAGTVGIIGIIPTFLDGANLTENADKLCNLRNVNQLFLAYLLSSHVGQKQIYSYIGVGAQPKLALNRLKKILIPLPLIKEQKKIAAILSEADAKIEKEQTQKAQLQALKKGLMQQLLTGKKRVKV